MGEILISSLVRQRVAVALVAALVVATWGAPALAPLSIAVVFAHECSHALAAVLTGGRVIGIEIGMDEGGGTWTEGGWPLIVLNAGYLGSLASGLLLLRGVRWSGALCAAIGILSVAVAVVWMPWRSFGFGFAVLWGGALITLASWAATWVQAAIVRLYGVFSVVYALGDVLADVFGAPAGAVNDATLLAARTGVPATVWGAGWLCAGVLAMWFSRSRV
jgi:hypothetical protein